MKKNYLFNCLLALAVFLFKPMPGLHAQCNVNDKYDKIISGYHSSIALKNDGVYCVWGSSMDSSGAVDQLAPKDINNTNYPALTGTVIKAALGGKSGGAAVDQAVLLTSNGLYAWGIKGNVLNAAQTATAKFARITSPTGATALGLPTGLTPDSVANLFASYQTLVLQTKGGFVFVLTQTSLAVEANGGVVSTAGSSQWKQVKINAGTFLSGVIAVRGQVYNVSNNAFMALTSSGQLYTWGNTSFLGNGSACAARNYATLMTLPAEFASSVPKMIGVTGGGGSGATADSNTYYVLSNAGNLYSLGNNLQKQCGDFTTTNRLSWVQVKKSAAANDYLTNINSFSCQEHDASFPAVAAITSSGVIYTWGNNSSGMCGRSDNNAIGGTLAATLTCDPGTIAGFSGTAITIEMGGHTMVYTKEGSTQFCYVGHYTNGSMGDGTSGNNGASSATTLKHDCSSTPAISICGYVPVAASTVNSTIGCAVPAIVANGSSTDTITITLRDGANLPLSISGGVVVVYTTDGTLGNVVDNNNGTYTVVLISSSSVLTTIATLSFSVNGTMASGTTTVTFTVPLPLTWLTVFAYRHNKNVNIEWTTEQELNLSHFEIERSTNGRDWIKAAGGIPASNQALVHRYLQVDPDFFEGKLFYRIRQVGLDGRSSYSPVAIVAADEKKDQFLLYPLPVTNRFFLGRANPALIQKVELLSTNGAIEKTWKTAQPGYDISTLPRAVYLVKITNIDNTSRFIRIVKQ